MSDSPIHVAPRAFISYSWTTPAHEAWVLDLAMRLVSDGIDIILDKWELRPGHDSYAFMESMVTDPTVTKVIMICDQAYVTKANARAGGVGTEGQIISPELYGKVAQNKYAALVTEVDERGHRHVPMFYKGRIYFDFVSGDAFEAQYEALLRWLADKPLFVKPSVGRLPEKILAPLVALKTDVPPKAAVVSQATKPKPEKRVLDEGFGRSVVNLAIKEAKRARNQGEPKKAMRLALGGWAIARLHSESALPQLVATLADMFLNDRIIFNISDQSDKLNFAIISPSGSSILTFSNDYVSLYRIEDKKPFISFNITDIKPEVSAINWALFSRCGQNLAVITNESIILLQLSTGLILDNIAQMHSPMDFSPDRKFLISCCINEIKKYDLTAGKIVKNFVFGVHNLTTMRYSSDSKTILITNSIGKIAVIDAILGDVIKEKNSINSTSGYAIFSPDDSKC
jgi:TIR domain